MVDEQSLLSKDSQAPILPLPMQLEMVCQVVSPQDLDATFTLEFGSGERTVKSVPQATAAATWTVLENQAAEATLDTEATFPVSTPLIVAAAADADADALQLLATHNGSEFGMSDLLRNLSGVPRAKDFHQSLQTQIDQFASTLRKLAFMHGAVGPCVLGTILFDSPRARRVQSPPPPTVCLAVPDTRSRFNLIRKSFTKGMSLTTGDAKTT